ncbi:unnamed protein product [Symbiodinium sp. KB8]|nr:unnamed protein product [Symbiodinium sp. KB8]
MVRRFGSESWRDSDLGVQANVIPTGGLLELSTFDDAPVSTACGSGDPLPVPLAEVIDLTVTDDAPVEQSSVTESVSASEVVVDPAVGVVGDFGSDGPMSSSAPQGAAMDHGTYTPPRWEQVDLNALMDFGQPATATPTVAAPPDLTAQPAPAVPDLAAQSDGAGAPMPCSTTDATDPSSAARLVQEPLRQLFYGSSSVCPDRDAGQEQQLFWYFLGTRFAEVLLRLLTATRLVPALVARLWTLCSGTEQGFAEVRVTCLCCLLACCLSCAASVADSEATFSERALTYGFSQEVLSSLAGDGIKTSSALLFHRGVSINLAWRLCKESIAVVQQFEPSWEVGRSAVLLNPADLSSELGLYCTMQCKRSPDTGWPLKWPTLRTYVAASMDQLLRADKELWQRVASHLPSLPTVNAAATVHAAIKEKKRTFDEAERGAARQGRRVFDVSSMQFMEEPASASADAGASSCGHEAPGSSDATCASPATGTGEDSTEASLLLGTVLRSEVLHYMCKEPLQILVTCDDWQLAIYLQFRCVAFDRIEDWGSYYYFEQFPCTCDAQRREIQQNIAAELQDRDYQVALRFFRTMLDGDFRERFYTALYQEILCKLRESPQTRFFADSMHELLRPAPSDSEA